jgi:glyoxylase-like metal-dependent hydrolase (beta-lactamase superfamily II)
MDRINPQDWYRISKVGDDVTYICEPHIKEFYRCNIWHVRGRDSDMLVDSGMGVVSLCPTRENTLATPYVTDDIFTGLPSEPYRSSIYSVQQAPASRLLEDGDVIDLGNRIFEIIHTPGHSPGGIALWEEKTGILFSGDIHYDGPLIEDAYHSDQNDYIRSMERLLEIPIRVVHGGHFASFGADRHRLLIRNWLDEKQGSG